MLAVFAAIALALSLGLSSYAYANPLDDLTNAVTSFFTGSSRAATVDDDSAYAADGDTRGTYTNVLGDNSSTRYDGRVWTDKTVSTEDVSFDGIDATVQNDSDFLVTYSALATSTQVSGESQVPVDVVFVIDNSNSMDKDVEEGSFWNPNPDSRLEATVDAVNASIAQIMESNPESRVAVVLYGMEAEVLLPLDHYEPMWNGDYISCNYSSSNTFTATGNHRVYMSTNDRGTNTHLGVDAGMDILKSATNIGEGSDKHVPSLILLSDGASTASGSGNWWDPSGIAGDGMDTANSYALKVAMNAQYNKQLVNQHYGVTDTDSDYACKVYTIGMGIEQLNGNDYRRAQMALDPGEHITDNNNVANAIESAWNQYNRGFNNTPSLDGYRFNHPQTNDISTIAYNDGYYSAENAEDVTNVFNDITSSIITSRPSVPTEVTGDDPTADGYITYTDTTGEYMEIKDVKTLIWSDQVYTQKNSSTNGNVTTYTFEGDSIDSPVYGEHSVGEISITVTDNDDHTQTIEVKIPASAIPLRVNTISLDAQGSVDTNTSNNAMPLRLVYSVGFESGIDPTTLAGIDGADGVSEDYIEAKTDGDKVNFYSNLYSAGTDEQDEKIGAHVTFTPASTNPFYFFQEDTPIYTDQYGHNQATSFSEDETYYIPVTYYSGTSEQTTYIPRSGADMADYVAYERVQTGPDWRPSYENHYYIKAGSPRLGNLQDVTASKATAPGANDTDTAANYREPVYGADGAITVLLGNNGRLQLDAPASLTITKNVTADEGLTAPAGTFEFQITSTDKAGQQVKAVKTTPSTTGGQPSTEDITVEFNDQGVATVELSAGQSVELKNMAGAEYSIVETELPDGFAIANVEGADQVSDDHVASGTVDNNSDGDSVTFTNNYSVSSITTDELNIDLGGTKSIDGRDFQQGDNFTFKIEAAQATPNAPLPENTTVTISPTSGTSAAFSFDDVTFTAPGEYRYIITEVNPNDDGDDETVGLGGVDYDSSIYRVNIVIVDNGDGTMRLATTDEIADMSTQGDLKYTSNPMV